jgi:hypothetical protein
MLKSGDLVKVYPDDAPEFETATVEYVGPVLVEVTGNTALRTMNIVELHGGNLSESVVFVVTSPPGRDNERGGRWTWRPGVFANCLATFSERGMLDD